MNARISFGRLVLGFMAAIAVLAAPASARTIEEVVYDGVYPAASFDGTGSEGAPSPFPGGRMPGIAVDQDSGAIYVVHDAGRLYKFNSAGNPQAFSALAPKTAIVQQINSFNGVDLFVDNTDGPLAGRIYLVNDAKIQAFEPDGEPAPNYPIPMPGACGGDVDLAGNLWVSDQSARKIVEYDPVSGEPTGRTASTSPTTIVPCDVAFDSNGDFYVNDRFNFEPGVKKYNLDGDFLELLDDEFGETSPRPTVDLSNDHVYVTHGSYALEYDENGILIDKFGQSSGPYPGFSASEALAVVWSTHKVYVPSQSSFPPRVDRLANSGVPLLVPGVTTGSAEPDSTTATLNATVDPDGVATTDCHFEWGRTRAYTGTPVPCNEGNVITGSGNQAVTGTLTELNKGSTYHYRISAKNANGYVVLGRNKSFIAQGKPIVSDEFATHVNSDGVRINGTIDPDGGPTTFHVEYGSDTNYGSIAPVPDQKVLGRNSEPHAVSQEIAGLQSGVEYHYRIVATNHAGTTKSSTDHTFTTRLTESVPVDKCPNALARQQTGAAQLLDCRAYELVSAANTNGYDVESAMVPGQKPYVAHPRAEDRVLYGMHNGGIPGTGSPTNNGVDPYVATRGEEGWTTKYVGIPSDATPSLEPFASPLAAADESLSIFAFGGAVLCDPCLPDGTSGIPLRISNGVLTQGMAGNLDPGGSLTPDGLVLEHLSADGTHLVFGSAEQFESDGNSNGDVSIYDRNLVTGETQVVSTAPDGTNLPCLQGAGTCHSPGNQAGIAELEISADGSRILVAQRVSTDAKGNHHWHPYMHVGTSANTIDLAPGTGAGVLFNGMTDDGSKVFMTTTDDLVPQDTDVSADIYVADVGTSTATISLVSVDSAGNPRNDDGCTPSNKPNSWNTAVGEGKCSALAFAGGAGLAAGDGTFYFLSPEQLDGSEGAADQANLYLVEPDEDPQFVTVMDSTTGKASPKRQDYIPESPELITGLAKPSSLAVDQRNGDLYVLEESANQISRFDSSGAPKGFSSGESHVSGNKLTEVGFWGFFSGRDQIAVDGKAGSPMEGTIYATGANSSQLTIFANTGEKIGAIPTIEEVGLGTCGVAVDQTSGTLYVAESSFYSTSRIRRFVPKNSPTLPIDATDYTETQLITSPNSPCSLSADSKYVYGTMTNPFTVGFEAVGPTYKLQVGDFSSSPFTVEGDKMIEGTKASAVDPANGDVYIDELDQISRFDKFGNLKQVFGLGQIGTASAGVAIDSPNGYAYVSDTSGGKIVRYEAPLPPARPIDNPAIEHAADANGVRRHGDFQVTPDGRYAAFASVEPVTGYASFGTLQTYRYDTEHDEVDCTSCMTTNARPLTNASLASHGLSLIDDGRLFFTSSEPLVLRDTDEKKDAYEWSEGTVQLISTGASQFGSELFSASADGKDVFFFTRETLAPEDQNGSVMKIYDAREEGGWFSIPEPPQCAASDECHGPSSPVPPNAGIASLAGTEGNQTGTKPKPRKCRKGFVKRGGKCVKKKKSKRKRRHR